MRVVASDEAPIMPIAPVAGVVRMTESGSRLPDRALRLARYDYY